MSAFFASCISTALEAVILAAVAVAGIVLGKKFRDKKVHNSNQEAVPCRNMV